MNGGKHVTDVTNASRTMLMNIENLKWDSLLMKFFEIPQSVLPEIKSSSEVSKYNIYMDISTILALVFGMGPVVAQGHKV